MVVSVTVLRHILACRIFSYIVSLLVGAAGNGLIDFDEFCEMMQGRLTTSSLSPTADQLGNDFRSLFMAFDKDNNGYIDGDELRQTMSAVGLQLSDGDVAMMMRAAGVPSGGRIYYEGQSDYFRLAPLTTDNLLICCRKLKFSC